MLPNTQLKYFSVAKTPFPYRVENHIHPLWEIVYYKTGKGKTILNDTEFFYKPNTYVIIPPELSHAEESQSEENSLACLGFDIDSVDRDFLPVRLFSDTEDKTILSLIDKIGCELKNAQLHYKDIISSAVSEIFFLTKRLVKDAKDNADQRVEMIKEYIDNYFNTDINLVKLAENFFYSYDYLRHIFKKKMGVGLKEYILNRRIQQAKQMLSENYPIHVIAEKSRFCSPSHFSACFLSVTGMTPGAYRKSIGPILNESGPLSFPSDNSSSSKKNPPSPSR